MKTFALICAVFISTVRLNAEDTGSGTVVDVPHRIASQIVGAKYATIRNIPLAMQDKDASQREITVEDYAWIQKIAKILSVASFSRLDHIFDMTTIVTFYDGNGKMLHDLQVFHTARVKLDGVDYMVERNTSDAIAQLIKVELPAPDLYQELLNAARSGLWLHVVGAEMLFDGGSWLVILEAPDKERFAVVLLNERRAEREGVAVAPFDLDRPNIVHGLSRTAEAELKVALAASLAKYQPVTATVTLSDGDSNTTVLREALSSPDLTAPSRVHLKEMRPIPPPAGQPPRQM